MKHHVCFRLTLACLAVASLLSAADGKRSITDVDLYNFRWIANAQISPDGAQVIYTLVKTTPKHDDYETSLWIVPSAGGAARQLTSGPHDSSARWSPDGKLVAFVRSTQKDGKPQPAQIYLLAMDGGEARPLTDLPKGAAGPVWSPDGRIDRVFEQHAAQGFRTEEGRRGAERRPRDHQREVPGERRRLSGTRSPQSHLGGSGAEDAGIGAKGRSSYFG